MNSTPAGHEVLNVFRRITEIPHPTEGEAPLAAWIRERAQSHGWSVTNDQIGNLLISVPATPGMEDSDSVCLQAHLDMVCIDADGKQFGAEKYPLKLVERDGWLSADGTTLGADNGIGVALALVAAENAPQHGPLELLFTVQEETGLAGASKLQLLVSSKRLINLDSEDWGMVFVGCAGGVRMQIDVEVPRAPFTEQWKEGLTITVDGLQGGHSGLEIVHKRGNAIRILGQCIHALQEHGHTAIATIAGGSRTNAIPTTASATIATEIPGRQIADTLTMIAETLKREFAERDPGLRISWKHVDVPDTCIPVRESRKLIGLLLDLPDGVLTMSSVEGIPETSSNVAVISMPDEGHVQILVMPRSSLTEALQSLKADVTRLCTSVELPGLHLAFLNQYPGWQPDLTSPLLRMVKMVWKNVHKTDPTVTSIHAGLECGILGGKLPGVEMVSFGPDIKGAHTVGERVSLDTVYQCYQLLEELLFVLAV